LGTLEGKDMCLEEQLSYLSRKFCKTMTEI
jgi:hypothetical protein